jgi:DNA replication protein DnaC
MTDEIAQLLANLHLTRIAEILDDELGHAEKKDLGYQEVIARLLRAQWHHRQETALAWRIKRAGIPEQWTLESFPWKRQPGVSQKLIRGFAELDFIPKAENIVFIGPTAVGKTGLASSLLLKALQNGVSVRSHPSLTASAPRCTSVATCWPGGGAIIEKRRRTFASKAC